VAASPSFKAFLSNIEGKGYFEGCVVGSVEYLRRHAEALRKFAVSEHGAALQPAASAPPAPPSAPAAGVLDGMPMAELVGGDGNPAAAAPGVVVEAEAVPEPVVVAAAAVPEAETLSTPAARSVVARVEEVARPNSCAVLTRHGPRDFDASNWVSDGAHALNPQSVATLNGVANTLYALYGCEMTVVTLDDVSGRAGRDLHGFATQLFNHWGLGDPAVGNGLLVLLVKKQRAVEIVTGEAHGQGHGPGMGRGMLQVLPAQWLSNTVDRCMVPSFRQGDFGEGLVRGVERAAEQICVSSAVSLTAATLFRALGTALWLSILRGLATGGEGPARHRELEDARPEPRAQPGARAPPRATLAGQPLAAKSVSRAPVYVL
jgi:hypothetical protein